MNGSIPDGYRLERNLLWPATDRDCAAVVFDGVHDLEIAYQFCRRFDVAVQAGGNCGVWPAKMAERFGTVFTFEPDPMNFRCLCANAPEERIVKFNAALGDHHNAVGLLRDPRNVGAHSIQGSGTIPVLRIDDLVLDKCDLIYLDVEGFELNALRGAADTIRRLKPVVVAEDKGHSEKYGFPQGFLEQYLAIHFGYQVAARQHRDIALTAA